MIKINLLVYYEYWYKRIFFTPVIHKHKVYKFTLYLKEHIDNYQLNKIVSRRVSEILPNRTKKFKVNSILKIGYDKTN